MRQPAAFKGPPGTRAGAGADLMRFFLSCSFLAIVCVGAGLGCSDKAAAPKVVAGSPAESSDKSRDSQVVTDVDSGKNRFPRFTVSVPKGLLDAYTLSWCYVHSEVAIVAEPLASRQRDTAPAEAASFKVLQILKEPLGRLEVGDKFVLQNIPPTNRNQVLILENQKDEHEWLFYVEAPTGVIEYLRGFPRDNTSRSRITYLLKFLDVPDKAVDEMVQEDLAAFGFKELQSVADQLPREKIRKWFAEPAGSGDRLGAYGLMLGLCGHEEDATLLEQKIFEPVAQDELRMGIDGVCIGYLMLKGERGLEVLEQRRLKDKESPFSEVYAIMKTLQFFREQVPERIAADRLKVAMRLLLDRTEIADVVITDLTKWRDWDVQERLFKMYGEKDSVAISIRRAIIRHLLASQKDNPEGTTERAPHAIQAQKFLEEIGKRDPKTLKDLERFPPL